MVSITAGDGTSSHGSRGWAYGAYGAWVDAFQRLYGGLGFLVRGDSGTGTVATSEEPRGDHPAIAFSGSVAIAWSCPRDTGHPSGGVAVLRYVLSDVVGPVESLVCCDGVSFWLWS